jgi:hypothetical protein
MQKLSKVTTYRRPYAKTAKVEIFAIFTVIL